MSIVSSKPFTRRIAVVGVLSSWATLRTGITTARQTGRPAPLALGHGLEVRDYRLFPTEDVMRFIVELHNTTDTAVDTPSVGVVLPNFDETENFGWASPTAPVLHPHSSGCLIGVAPLGMETDHDWGEAKWTLCGDPGHKIAKVTDHWSFVLDSSIEILKPTVAKVLVSITNQTSDEFDIVYLQGGVLDSQGRFCGTTVTGTLVTMRPSETRTTGFTISPAYSYISNPLNLIKTVDDISVAFTIQPREVLINQHCASVMPW